MARAKKQRESLPPIWRVPDELWAIVEPIIAELDPPNRVGPKRVPARPILDAIIYRGRTGCQWNRLPQEYPDASTVHRAFQRWKRLGVFERLWAVLIERCEDLDGVDWEWQAVDGAMGKARKDVLSQPFQRWDSEIVVMRGCWGGETEGSRTLAPGSLGWYAEVGRKGEQAAVRLSARFSVGGGSADQAAAGRVARARLR